jgi:hypothetical protein
VGGSILVSVKVLAREQLLSKSSLAQDSRFNVTFYEEWGKNSGRFNLWAHFRPFSCADPV